jgi:hypothetical protein
MKQHVESLIEVVRLLASPAPMQLQHLAAIGLPNGVDELALEFDDVAALAKGMRERGELSESQLVRLQALDDQLERMSGAVNAALWTADALAERREWAEVRRLATDALADLVAASPTSPQN